MQTRITAKELANRLQTTHGQLETFLNEPLDRDHPLDYRGSLQTIASYHHPVSRNGRAVLKRAQELLHADTQAAKMVEDLPKLTLYWLHRALMTNRVTLEVQPGVFQIYFLDQREPMDLCIDFLAETAMDDLYRLEMLEYHVLSVEKLVEEEERKRDVRRRALAKLNQEELEVLGIKA